MLNLKIIIIIIKEDKTVNQIRRKINAVIKFQTAPTGFSPMHNDRPCSHHVVIKSQALLLLSGMKLGSVQVFSFRGVVVVEEDEGGEEEEVVGRIRYV